MLNILLDPIAPPSAWKSADLADYDDWIYRLTSSDTEELLEATAKIRERGLFAVQFDQKDFPLTGLALKISEIHEELENGRGFVMLRGLPVDGLDDDDLYRLYWGLGQYLGTPLIQNKNGQRIVEITEQGVTYGAQVRGYMTTANLMPHSDASDLVSLFCIQPAHSGGESCISSAMTMHNAILAEHPDYLERLYAGFNHSLRGESATGDPDEVTRHAIPVFSYFANKLSFHFNRRLIIQGAEKMGTPLDDKTIKILDYVNDLALRDDIRFDMNFMRGDVQLLNNHTIVHSRQDYVDDPERKRRLLRLWTNVPNGRPLAPEFADRTNGGPRGGMRVAKGANATSMSSDLPTSAPATLQARHNLQRLPRVSRDGCDPGGQFHHGLTVV
jgi:hypothetical protein